jgi:hypothetical protein
MSVITRKENGKKFLNFKTASHRILYLRNFRIKCSVSLVSSNAGESLHSNIQDAFGSYEM